ncbi:MAG: nucleoside recognition protein [Candidatus Marinimicrobia bacterium]|nr:nucleoside recognition protein [Candidatus Neomarinimicrobiota bacterium]
MLNYIWFGLIAIAVVTGLFNGTIDAVTDAAFASARQAVELAIGLVGAMALWLGIMRIADKAGLVAVLARGIRPIARRLFPDIPDGHPALGSIVMNMAANILGLGNAATPMGLKAMKELQELNPEKDAATDSMVMFLAINTSSVQILLPASVVGLMGARAGDIFIPVLVATTISTTVAIIAAKWLQKRPRFAVQTTHADDGEAA